jgi:hypothetical protein
MSPEKMCAVLAELDARRDALVVTLDQAAADKGHEAHAVVVMLTMHLLRDIDACRKRVLTMYAAEL